MQITATEFKLNLGHYFELVKDEDIWISKNGKIIADYGYYQFGRGISTEPENSGTEQQAEPEMQETTTHTDYEAYPQPKGNGPDPTNE